MDEIRKQLEKIFAKMDSIDDRVNSIDKTLVKQEAQLAEHIRRTELLENKIEPIQKHVHMMNGALKFIGIVALFLGILVSIIKIFFSK